MGLSPLQRVQSDWMRASTRGMSIRSAPTVSLTGIGGGAIRGIGWLLCSASISSASIFSPISSSMEMPHTGSEHGGGGIQYGGTTVTFRDIEHVRPTLNAVASLHCSNIPVLGIANETQNPGVKSLVQLLNPKIDIFPVAKSTALSMASVNSGVSEKDPRNPM